MINFVAVPRILSGKYPCNPISENHVTVTGKKTHHSLISVHLAYLSMGSEREAMCRGFARKRVSRCHIYQPRKCTRFLEILDHCFSLIPQCAETCDMFVWIIFEVTWFSVCGNNIFFMAICDTPICPEGICIWPRMFKFRLTICINMHYRNLC